MATPNSNRREARKYDNSVVTLKVPDDLVLHFSDNFSVVNVSGTYYLYFYQTQPPTGNVGPLPETIEQRCVARVVLNATTFASLAQNLEQTANRDQLPSPMETLPNVNNNDY